MVEIALQSESKGVIYEGFRKTPRQCIFEEGDVEGRNERYEFKCDYDLECCGRTCCIPEDATIPLWLLILCIFFAILLLLCILAALAYWLAKRRKPKPKKDFNEHTGGYTALTTEKNAGDSDSRNGRNGHRGILVQDVDPYNTTDHYGYDGYGNRGYNTGYDSRRGYGIDGRDGREIAIRRDYGPPRRDSRATVSSDGASLVRHGVHETVEEHFKQEITYERPASTDSREML